MKKIIALLLLCLTAAADVKITDLPSVGGSVVGNSDVFPMVRIGTSTTSKLKISELFLVPALSAQLALLAPVASPVFTGTIGTPLTPSKYVVTDSSGNLTSGATPASFSNLTAAGTDGIAVTGGTGAVAGSGTSLAQHVSDATHNGYLSSTDWVTFNAKQATLSLGNLGSGTTGLSVSGGTGAVVGSGATITIQTASASQPGILAAADFTTFNNKGSVSSVTFTGDGTILSSTPSSAVTTTGTVTATLASHAQNLFLATPNGSSGVPTARSIVGADLPIPGASTPGGVLSKAVVSNQFLTGISSLDGSVSAAQPSFSNLSGTASAAQGGTGGNSSASSGVAHLSSGSWTYSSIVNADVSASAAIDFSKLASLTSGNLLLGNGSNVPTSTAVTGPVTISNAGVTTFVDEFTGHVQTAANATYWIDPYPGFAYTINSLAIYTSSGTITCGLQINGTVVTSLSALSVTSTPQIVSASGANTVSAGASNAVTLVCISNSGALDLVYTMKITR